MLIHLELGNCVLDVTKDELNNMACECYQN